MLLITSYRLIAAWVLFGVCLAISPAVRAEDYAADGPHKVQTVDDKWIDANRGGRVVPYRIYYPADLKEPAPVIIFSHGLGGSREGYGYIGKHLASHGYIAVHVQHAGSDRDSIAGAITDDGKTLDEAMKQSAADPANVLNRPKDISFAIDQLIEMNKKEGALKGKIDGGRMGVAGHSFGAYTVMAVAGQTFAKGINFRDDRIKAAVAMSASPPRAGLAKPYDAITIPVLLLTGTLDDSPIGGTQAADRLKVFDLLPHEKYMVVFDGGDHMVFSGRSRELEKIKIPGKSGDASKDEAFHTFVKASTVAFFDAHLKGDEAAKKWLTADDGAKAALGQAGSWKAKEK